MGDENEKATGNGSSKMEAALSSRDLEFLKYQSCFHAMKMKQLQMNPDAVAQIYRNAMKKPDELVVIHSHKNDDAKHDQK